MTEVREFEYRLVHAYVPFFGLTERESKNASKKIFPKEKKVGELREEVALNEAANPMRDEKGRWRQNKPLFEVTGRPEKLIGGATIAVTLQ